MPDKPRTPRLTISQEIDVAERKAWDSLGRYKFQMFGYWAAIWVHLNRISGEKRKNPWRELVEIAKQNDDREKDYLAAFDKLQTYELEIEGVSNAG
jgi:hypothetical protein